MRSVILARSAIALALLSAAGCDATDPFLRQGVWNPRGSNAANLATMVEDPMDLVHGRRDDRASGLLAAAAIARLRHDEAKSLPSLDTSQLTGGGSSSSGRGSQQAGAPGQAEAQ